jgi:hypothetical protein
VVVEVELIDSEGFIEFGLLESESDGVLPAMIRLQLCEVVEDKKGVVIFIAGLFKDRFQVLGHDLETKMEELFFDAV